MIKLFGWGISLGGMFTSWCITQYSTRRFRKYGVGIEELTNEVSNYYKRWWIKVRAL